MTWTMVDGVGMPSVEARVPADDPAVTLGWSVFETLGYPGADLDLHLARLTHSCLRTHIDPPPAALLRREIEAVGQRFPQGARIRITLTGGGHRLVLVVTGPSVRFVVRTVMSPSWAEASSMAVDCHG
jgi:branched-subunit amino acid aminotransferase/4-amino-4-deoxychorismate lyase